MLLTYSPGWKQGISHRRPISVGSESLALSLKHSPPLLHLSGQFSGLYRFSNSTNQLLSGLCTSARYLSSVILAWGRNIDCFALRAGSFSVCSLLFPWC